MVIFQFAMLAITRGYPFCVGTDWVILRDHHCEAGVHRIPMARNPFLRPATASALKAGGFEMASHQPEGKSRAPEVLVVTEPFPGTPGPSPSLFRDSCSPKLGYEMISVLSFQSFRLMFVNHSRFSQFHKTDFQVPGTV